MSVPRTLLASLAIVVAGVATLANAGPGKLAFLANPRYRAQLAQTGAGAVVMRDVPAGATVYGAPARVLGPQEVNRG